LSEVSVIDEDNEYNSLSPEYSELSELSELSLNMSNDEDSETLTSTGFALHDSRLSIIDIQINPAIIFLIFKIPL